jgi:hypothetical protein
MAKPRQEKGEAAAVARRQITGMGSFAQKT